ncbi:hypothetical protein UC8_42590 [Roseimaritima ulvae]|uniref:Double zinc ribbon n=2 Tax=Roseimaritima ulvae TaxID=980254 RepID=A0A5B9QXW1_9BACT|nr:hypothetical protein UC8_42590 [Roseimaritima ulvae]
MLCRTALRTSFLLLSFVAEQIAMPIAATCACGKKLQVKDELAGKRVRCPNCKQPLTIPANQPAPQPQAPASPLGGGMDDLFEEEGFTQRQGATCPNCTREMKPGAILCIECGFNTQTGEMLAGHQTEAERAILGHSLLDKAQSDMATDDELQRKMQNAGMPWWVLLIMLLCLVGLAVMFVMGVNFIKGDPDEEAAVEQVLHIIS